jgi:hypothetical protein
MFRLSINFSTTITITQIYLLTTAYFAPFLNVKVMSGPTMLIEYDFNTASRVASWISAVPLQNTTTSGITLTLTTDNMAGKRKGHLDEILVNFFMFLDIREDF